MNPPLAHIIPSCRRATDVEQAREIAQRIMSRSKEPDMGQTDLGITPFRVSKLLPSQSAKLNPDPKIAAMLLTGEHP